MLAERLSEDIHARFIVTLRKQFPRHTKSRPLTLRPEEHHAHSPS